MTTVRVNDLKTGDTLSSGAKVISSPTAGLMTPKGKVEIGIQYPNGKCAVQTWGKFTTVGII